MSFEINTSTYLKKNFDIKILKRYKELGGELITLGSDAHNLDIIAKNFKLYSQIIKDCGFKYLFSFKDGKPIAHII